MLLSIITINRNNAPGLANTFNSVRTQTWQDFEYLVIDGASIDESVELIRNNADIIDYWASEPDTGIYNAINKGILRAKGKYLLILNSGDILNTPGVLEALSTYFEQNSDIIYGNTELVAPGKKSRFKTPPTRFYFDYLTHNTLVHQSVFIKRSLHQTAGLYNENLKIVADWAFLLDATAKHSATSEYVNLIISSYDMTGDSVINKASRIETQKKYLQTNYKFFVKKTVVSFKELTLRERIIFIAKSLLPYALVNRILSKRHNLCDDDSP